MRLTSSSGQSSLRRPAVLLLAALLLAPQVAPAQRSDEQPSPPRYFAIRNARLVPVSGPVIERGTIVLANGLIAALGPEAAIPPEAWVMEGEGLTVYPGLIDTLTNLALPAPPAAGAPAGAEQAMPQAARQPIAHGPEDRPGTTSWENAADELKPDDKRLEDWRKAGFTSVVTVAERGIFPGQAAFINLAGERANEMVVKTPAALRVNLTPVGGFWSFPGSLMGVLAYIKQVFIDADHYAAAWSLYSAEPRGRERPGYDRALAPIRDAVGGGWPVLMPATWAKEIERALRLGDELGVRTIVYGAHQGYAAADALAAKKVPVLVSLKWPERAADADPEAEEPLRVLRFRAQAPSTPAALEKAGVRFAFYSDGLANPADILKNARKAIEAGLPAEAALRAFTLSAAEIYSVADRLGSLEPGKVANLVVTDGELFGEKTKVKMVFIDGRKYEVREPGRPAEPPGVNLTGRWTLSMQTPRGVEERTAELTMAEDGTLSGSITGPRGEASISSGWVSGNKFSFTVRFSVGPRTLEATYSGTVEGDKMTGSVTVARQTVEFTGTRAAPPKQDTAGAAR
ncbi:MAG: amidohydrolase family protein [Acidobacteria bacterium]|nr:amidohydrolase family protein [Acidobacteriota bacterium]